jgi:hypothetical protein
MRAAYPVDLTRIGRTHDRQQDGIALGTVLGQIIGQKIRALGCTAAHQHAGNARMITVCAGHLLSYPLLCRLPVCRIKLYKLPRL